MNIPTKTPNGVAKPFSQGYVLRTTTKHMLKSVDVSISKTFERIAEFDGNQQKSQEVFRTLSMLHTLRKAIDDFQSEYKEEFTGA